ncbi:uncharacterized protein [Fopius arisanus]|uniref:Uncharacterized protein isoform X1 n=1 Tax=Fopius arisanus TaxID=64838 RepID=A0A9R1TSW4_9HYME|nr:PREDICTED: uncharacterized protein LOC105274046 isoform X1 [Fopius arisanus]XP_011315151.1 PREDICTED: uncharacterized protein LOC105274046 isoform X1 [Fopius arisanus]XP_011315152.1 PREDICTED: uncharacterized protein LOC105274046 isoform X1 [Fopius arisanus]XP_011315153.1 PREDICTED: uncharacterized protein LOC105274046 isoform X1 [Fopius arisanus]
MYYQAIALNLVLISVSIQVIACEGCNKEDHQKCVALADPLLKDAHLIFPDNMRDIDMVCRTWSSFVDCIKRYIDRCFTKQRREQFNQAVESPIASVHQMCSVTSYQTEYLQYASCLKATVTEAQHCGNQYTALVDEVSQGEMARRSLCCAHHHFRACVITETRKRCDGGQPGGAASRFSGQILDRALSFLQEQCQAYIPNGSDCPEPVTDSSLALAVSPLDEESGNRGISRRPYQRTLSPDNYAGQASTFHGASTNTINSASSFRSTGRSLNVLPIVYHFLENEEPDVRPAPTLEVSNSEVTVKVDEAAGKAVDEKEISTVGQSIEEPAIIVTQRSPSYGRGMSWTSPSPKETTEIPAWATSTWPDTNKDSATESWYPAAGSFGGNNIDEPNQQGLKNGHNCLRSNIIPLVIITIALYFI